ncbi:MAG: helix-turn-helix transcriptional regulator [Oscillospiraceae bacterium]|nr:helix-turn-helix transcriptional regulator [Oscillospiraceae bacterium]
MTIGQRIAQERKKLNISQVGLATRLDVSRQAISKWESDAAIPEIDKLIALSKLFGVSVGWLLGVEDPTVSRTEALTEDHYKIIEELVKKYQAPPKSH